MTDPASITGVLARAMQGLRADRGWSLDQLAVRSGVSKGVLVATEQGRSNPNLATLARIADAFGVPVTRLIDTSGEPAVRITGPAEARVLWHGPAGGTGTILAATEPPWAAELWQWKLTPGERFGGDAHAAATRELARVEEGTLTLTVAGRGYQVGPGMCARFPGGLPHGYANEGTTLLRLTMIVVVPPAPA
jgi:transcriptional regulator with XRE-family HTH domain